jgi:hypothetical protein
MATTTIETASIKDADRLHTIWLRSFASDKHTLFKLWENDAEPEDELPRSVIDYWLQRPVEKGVFLKAVDESGNVAGWSVWGFWNLDNERV